MGAWVQQVLANFLGWLVGDVLQGMLNFLWGAIDGSSAIPFAQDASWVATYGRTAGIGLLLVLAMGVGQLGIAVAKSDPAGRRRAVTGMALGAVLTMTLPSLVQILNGAVDNLATGLSNVAASGVGTLGTKLAAAFAPSNGDSWVMTGAGIYAGGIGSEVALIAMIFAIVAALALSLILIARSAIVIALMVFAPFVLAGLGGAKTSSWFRHWSTWILSFVLAKLVIVLLLSVAVDLLADGTLGTSTTSSTTGTLFGATMVFGLAAFSPAIVHKFLAPFGFAGGGTEPSIAGAAGHVSSVASIANSAKLTQKAPVVSTGGDAAGGADAPAAPVSTDPAPTPAPTPTPAPAPSDGAPADAVPASAPMGSGGGPSTNANPAPTGTDSSVNDTVHHSTTETFDGGGTNPSPVPTTTAPVVQTTPVVNVTSAANDGWWT